MSVIMKASQPGMRFAPYVRAGPAPQRHGRLAGRIRPGRGDTQLPEPRTRPRGITVNIAK